MNRSVWAVNRARGRFGHNYAMSNGPYGELQKMLADSRALTDAAEAHGTLAGALCSAETYRLEDWLGEILPDGRTDDGALEGFRGYFEATTRELDGPDMTFNVLLPDDSNPLPERASALGAWCQGFLYGLGTSPIGDTTRLPGDAGEIVRDLIEISRIAVDDRESVESNETAYAELVEFVRVGVQLLFEELAPFRVKPKDPGEVLH